jgi:LytR cell envelope-related transcriptional attenuator
MKDFFDDLERQLVAATPQRLARIRRARARRAGAIASMIIVLLAGGAGIATAVGGTGGGGAGSPAGTGTTTTEAHLTQTTLPPPPPGPEPYSYEVAVLNGTAVPGLARAVGNQLAARQIRVGQTTNAPTQDEAVTQVYYRSPDCLPAANQVAAALHLGEAGGEFTLRKITKAQTALVGQGPAVVVVVGSDQNPSPSP